MLPGAARELALDPNNTDVRAAPVSRRCKIKKVAQDESPSGHVGSEPLVRFPRINNRRRWSDFALLAAFIHAPQGVFEIRVGKVPQHGLEPLD